MVNESKFQLIYFMILRGLYIAQLIFYGSTPIKLEMFANATNLTSNSNEKQEVRKKMLLAKTGTV